jgi:ribosomal protein S18 acetylase RimI-like enzyme
VVVIRALAEDEIPLVEAHFPRGMPGTHRERWGRQERGEIAYLIGWEDGLPVAHLTIEWAGATDGPATALAGCPNLFDFGVRPDRQSRGIGSRLLDAAERLAAGRGYRRVGLSVGLENVRARALYERRGYRDAGLGEYTARWPYLDKQGREGWEEERCTCLVKDLGFEG